MEAFRKLSLKLKLAIAFAIPLLLFIAVAITVNGSLNKLILSQKWVTHTHEAVRLGDEITLALVNMETGLRGYLVTGDSVFLEPYDQGSSEFEKLISHSKAHVSDNIAQVNRLEKVESLENDWQRNHVEPAISMRKYLSRGAASQEELVNFIGKAIGKKYMDEMRLLLNAFIEEEKSLIVGRNNEQVTTADEIRWFAQAGALIAIVLGVAGAFFLVRYLLGTLGGEPEYAIFVANRISNGELDETIKVMPGDTSSLIYAMDKMQSNLTARGQAEKAKLIEATRIKLALDVCDTNVMMADNDLDIIYMNNAVQEMMQTAANDLRKDLPNFDANNLIGQNIDVFHKNPSHQRRMLAALKDVYRTDIEVGGRTFGLIATPILADNGDRIGTVVEWDDKTERLEQEKEKQRSADEASRLKQALDAVTANVMVADADRNIIYANDAVVSTLRNAQDDLRKDLPNFNVDTMVGGSIDQFHKNPAHQKALLEGLTSTHRAKIVVGGRHMSLIVTPVVNDSGMRLGTVVEWSDQTIEVGIQQEMDTIIAAANDGKLTKRIAMEGKGGFFKTLGEGLNTLLDKVSVFVDDIGKMFEYMSEGDLTHEIGNEYRGEFEKIKQNANNSVAKLSEVMLRIQQASGSVSSSANEVAQGSDDLSRRTEAQASSLEETSSSMEEMTATVQQTSDNATQANSLAAEAKIKAQSGGAVVNNAVHAMSEILESSNKINDIIGVIDEIAFQTNLLALNAAVEAARAGEQGRGFAVVAGEVRTLSQRSAAAAKEIKDLIRDSVSKVESGSKLVNQSGQTLTEIVASVEKVASMIEDVNNASREQTTGIGQINQAITQMDEMTQQNAALVEETSAASRSMSDEANAMNNMISFFKLSYGTRGNVMGAAVSQVAREQEPIVAYQLPDQKGGSGKTAAFSEEDEWEDF